MSTPIVNMPVVIAAFVECNPTAYEWDEWTVDADLSIYNRKAAGSGQTFEEAMREFVADAFAAISAGITEGGPALLNIQFHLVLGRAAQLQSTPAKTGTFH